MTRREAEIIKLLEDRRPRWITVWDIALDLRMTRKQARTHLNAMCGKGLVVYERPANPSIDYLWSVPGRGATEGAG